MRKTLSDFTQEILITKIYPNPWNPNKTTARVDKAIMESIQRYGFIQPITVRSHPQEEDCYEVIDGEHRLETAKELGFGFVPCVVVQLNDADAKRFTIIANETRGRADDLALGLLLEEIQADLGDEMLQGLPYYEKEMEGIISKAHQLMNENMDLHLQPTTERFIIKHPAEGALKLHSDLSAWLREHYPNAKLVF